MSKIAIDARRIRNSTGRYTRELLNNLEQIDSEHDYHVIIHDLDRGNWEPNRANFKLHVVPYDHYTFGEQLGFAWFLYRLKADLVHFTMPQQPILYWRRKVTTVHDLILVRFKNLDENIVIYSLKQLIFRCLLWWVAVTSRHLITPTKFVRADLQHFSRVKLDKITHTYESASPLGGKQKKPAAPAAKRYLLYVGNAFPYKNLSRLAEAFSLINDETLHLVYIGKKDFFYEQVEAAASQLSAADRIHFLGFVPDDELIWYYENALAFVTPSLAEGFGLPGLEAMAHGVPVISSDETCLPEVYGNGAVYFDPTNPAEMAQVIGETVNSDKQLQLLRSLGRERLKKYSWQRMAEQTLKIYNDAL